MTDLTEALASIITDSSPSFQPTGGMTPDSVRALLDANGLKYTTVSKSGCDGGVQFNLTTCPFCDETEGNPSVCAKDGAGCFHCFRGNAGCTTKTFGDLLAKFKPPKPKQKLPRISALDLPGLYPHARGDVVKGLIRRGDVCNIIGGPKAKKSFLVEQMAICVAAGIPFLEFETVPGRVLLVDNELRPDDLSRRLTAMVAALGLKWSDVAANLDIMPLRGRLADIRAIHDELVESAGLYSLTVLDALYKAMPSGSDENSNSDMTAAFVMLDSAAERHNCAITNVHHSSKGSQRDKSVTDMGAGAGAQSRSADAHLVLRDHESPNTVVLQGVLRAQKPFKPVCLVFDHPMWTVAKHENPNHIAVAGAKKGATLDEFLATIPLEVSPKTGVLAKTKESLNLSKSTLAGLLLTAIEANRVEIVEPKNLRLPHTIRRIDPEPKGAAA